MVESLSLYAWLYFMTRQQIFPLDIIARLERGQEAPSNVDLNALDGDGFTVLKI